jgi:hypothetical protein
LALSGHTETICYLSAFGAKRTCRDRGRSIDPTRLTQSRHRPGRNPAVQRPATARLVVLISHTFSGGSTQHEHDMKPPKKAKQKSTAAKAKQRLISATSKSGGSLRRSGTNLEGSNMNYETKAADLWERTKAWADKNRTISGALVGGAAGTIVPGLGTTIGAVVGAGIGFASSMEKKE